jgi:hypothetical protein
MRTSPNYIEEEPPIVAAGFGNTGVHAAFTPSNVEGFGIMHCAPDEIVRPNALALEAISKVVRMQLPQEHELVLPLETVRLPKDMDQANNFTRACWLARTMLAGSKDIGIVDLNKANQIVAQLPLFMHRLAVNHFGCLIVSEADSNSNSNAVKQSDNQAMIRRIVSSLDDKPVLGVSNEGLRMLHADSLHLARQ